MSTLRLASIVTIAISALFSVAGCAATTGEDEAVPVALESNDSTKPAATTGASSSGGGETSSGTVGTSSSGGVSEKSKQQQMVACFNSCTSRHPGNWCVAYCDCVVYQGKNPMTCDAINPYIDL